MKYLRRLVWYLVNRLFYLCVVLSLFILTFYYAMNASDIYIVLKDGMADRAKVIMMDYDEGELTKFFHPVFIERDEALQIALSGSSPYSWYKIRGIDHRLEIKWLWCWPWDTTASVDFIERIPHIDGRILSDYREIALNSGGEDALNPPRWEAGKYKAIMVHENGTWRIKSIVRDNAWHE